MKETGRNDPCPCGSGKKYKKCCIGNAAITPGAPGQTAKPASHDFNATNVAPPSELLLKAVALHQAGQLDEAKAVYLSLLKINPDDSDALHYLGMISFQKRDYQGAINLIESAIKINRGVPAFHCNLGNAYKGSGQFDSAVAAFQEAVRLDPEFQAAYSNLGNALLELERFDEAATCYRKALSLRPDFAEAHYNLGNVLDAQGNIDAATESYRKALALKPDYAEAYNNLGNMLNKQGQLAEAVACFRQALMLKPDYAEAHYNLGNTLKDQGKLDEATICCQKALALKPDFIDAHITLGGVLRDQAKFDAAVESFHKALSIKPDHVNAYSNLLFTLNYHPDLSAEDICKTYQEYDARHGIPLKSTWRAHGNDRSPDRRLRVGYVSPDFWRHSGSSFLEPLLAHHDKARVEVYAYAELSAEDDLTARYKSYVEHWIPTKGMSDEALAERIRSDGIDILVELAGHTTGNRLPVFARKPAPVSLSWLGYGYTTGLGAVDYYLTDEASAPPGCEGLFAEQPWRIATPAYVYRPPASTGEVNGLPAQQRGYITFGTLSRSVRINHRTVRVWADLLKAVPGSRLVIDSYNFKEPEMQEQMVARFAEHGISRDRLGIGFHSPPWDVLRGIDIGLDCFPHNSGTTLFETLYMGIPYITLAGRPSVGRLGSSILQGVGHPEWIAGNEAEYVAKAAELANNVGLLAGIRAALRGRMENGPLMDEEGFARKAEDAYRRMWKIWCEKGDKT